MIAYDVSSTLVCRACGYPMQTTEAPRNRERKDRAYWVCKTADCINNGPVFTQDLPTVDLKETFPDLIPTPPWKPESEGDATA